MNIVGPGPAAALPAGQNDHGAPARSAALAAFEHSLIGLASGRDEAADYRTLRRQGRDAIAGLPLSTWSASFCHRLLDRQIDTAERNPSLLRAARALYAAHPDLSTVQGNVALQCAAYRGMAETGFLFGVAAIVQTTAALNPMLSALPDRTRRATRNRIYLSRAECLIDQGPAVMNALTGAMPLPRLLRRPAVALARRFSLAGPAARASAHIFAPHNRHGTASMQDFMRILDESAPDPSADLTRTGASTPDDGPVLPIAPSLPEPDDAELRTDARLCAMQAAAADYIAALWTADAPASDAAQQSLAQQLDRFRQATDLESPPPQETVKS